MEDFKQTDSKEQAKNHRNIAMIFGLLIIVLLICAGIFFYQKRFSNTPIAAAQNQTLKTAQALALPKSDPIKIEIPSIGVNASMVPLGLQKSGSIEVPQNGADVGWYIYGPTPGEIGPSVVVGHLDTVKGSAVFWKLSKLAPGDQVSITRTDGKTAVFTVTGSEKYSQDNFPSNAVYGKINYAGLRLITCNGTYIKSAGHYSDNLVVYAVLSQVK